VKKLALATAVLALALPAFGQAPEPAEPAPAPAPETETKPKSAMKDRFFFGGGIGAAFGSVDYVEIAPLFGLKVAPRVALGFQPFYSWTNDGRYSPSVAYTNYGARIFSRFRIVSNFFLEADYQFTSFEYLNTYGGTTRATNNAFLAGAGYTMPMGRNVGLYFSALYDFSYNDNDPYGAYYSPVQLQFGVAVGF